MMNSSARLHFPARLYQIIEIEDPSIIRWEIDGQSFRIVDNKRFRDETIPKYFHHGNSASIQRQLNLYGFRCANRIDEKGVFFHPKFVRGEYDEVRLIRRKKTWATKDTKETPMVQTAKDTYSSSSSSSTSNTTSNKKSTQISNADVYNDYEEEEEEMVTSEEAISLDDLFMPEKSFASTFNDYTSTLNDLQNANSTTTTAATAKATTASSMNMTTCDTNTFSTVSLPLPPACPTIDDMTYDPFLIQDLDSALGTDLILEDDFFLSLCQDFIYCCGDEQNNSFRGDLAQTQTQCC